MLVDGVKAEEAEKFAGASGVAFQNSGGGVLAIFWMALLRYAIMPVNFRRAM